MSSRVLQAYTRPSRLIADISGSTMAEYCTFPLEYCRSAIIAPYLCHVHGATLDERDKTDATRKSQRICVQSGSEVIDPNRPTPNSGPLRNLLPRISSYPQKLRPDGTSFSGTAKSKDRSLDRSSNIADAGRYDKNTRMSVPKERTPVQKRMKGSTNERRPKIYTISLTAA